MPSSLKKVAVRPDDGLKRFRITRPSGTLFIEKGLARLTVSSNAPYPLSPIPYPLPPRQISQSMLKCHPITYTTHRREIVLSLGSIESRRMVEGGGTREGNSSLSGAPNEVGCDGAWPLSDRGIEYPMSLF